MITDENEPNISAAVEEAPDEAEVKRKIDLEVAISDAGPCKKHLKSRSHDRRSTFSMSNRSKRCGRMPPFQGFGRACAATTDCEAVQEAGIRAG